jgi:putative flippase GtrA
MRFVRFNIVGAGGLLLQLALLDGLVRAGVPLVAATLMACEAAILHNFVWHDRWTFADRKSQIPNAKSQLDPTSQIKTDRIGVLGFVFGIWPLGSRLGFGRRDLGFSWIGRLLTFHAANGLVSLVGGTAFTWMLSGLGLPVIAANLGAVVLCAGINFLCADRVVFGGGSVLQHGPPSAQ